MSTQHYGNCAINSTMNILNELGGQKAGHSFKAKAKQFFGVGNLDGLQEAEQIKKMNAFWRNTLEPIPDTTFIRSWLENTSNLDEYMSIFRDNWAQEVIRVGALNK